MKKNCWEVMGCGREPGGKNADKLGVCPAATETRLDGVHGGKNAGRACWVVAGTMCEGAVQGTFAKKFGDCLKCKFLQMVIKEELKHFKTAAEMAKKLRKTG
ncbi:MAG: hypothetical protein Q8J64_01980 [Thermodesulfovibrionales bacterium]|nr:hypothetical protein [Thermodesulfovibrionales bacterium]